MTRTRLLVASILVFCGLVAGYTLMSDNRSSAERSSQRIAKAVSIAGNAWLVDKTDLYLVAVRVTEKGNTVLQIYYFATDKDLEEYKDKQEVVGWILEDNCPEGKECPNVTGVQIAVDEGPDGKVDGYLMRKNMEDETGDSTLIIDRGKKLGEEPVDASPEEMRMAQDNYEKFLQVVIRELENDK